MEDNRPSRGDPRIYGAGGVLRFIVSEGSAVYNAEAAWMSTGMMDNRRLDSLIGVSEDNVNDTANGRGPTRNHISHAFKDNNRQFSRKPLYET